jgi:hypothetical protein
MTTLEANQAVEAGSPYQLTDADEHSTPRFGAYEEYMDPDKRDLAIRYVRNDDGRMEVLYAGRPAKLRAKNFQVTFSDDLLAEVGVKGAGSSDTEEMGARGVVPGSLLNGLNPLKGLDAEGRRDFAKKYR